MKYIKAVIKPVDKDITDSDMIATTAAPYLKKLSGLLQNLPRR